MRTERGLHRLMNFSDAVVAIAITLLILPLVDSASNIGKGSVGPFLQHHDTQLLAFGLSFAVIWNFWWSQHQMHERVVGYNRLLVAGAEAEQPVSEEDRRRIEALIADLDES